MKTLCVLTAAVSAGMVGSANAQSVWTANSSGNWSAPGNWNTLPISSTATVIDFSTAGTYAATDDNTGAFSLNQLNLNNPSGTVTVAAGTGNYLSFGGTAPAISVLGPGNETISAQMSGGASLTETSTGLLALSGTNNYTGSTNIKGGTLTYYGAGTYLGGGALNVANSSSGSSTAVLNFSSTAAAPNYNFGGSAMVGSTGAVGIVNQTSGNLNLFASTSGAYFVVGSGGYGSYTLTGGSLNILDSSGIRIGGNAAAASNTSVGVFTQTAGTIISNRYISVGTNGYGVATFTGGTTSQIGAYRTIVSDNANSTGVLNIGTEAGGNAIYSTGGNGGLQLVNTGDTISGSGTVNLNSGTLIFTQGGIYKTGAGTGIVNLNGATIQSSVTGLNLINTTPTSVNVFNGGVTYNVSGSGISDTVSASMLAAASGGLYPTGTNAASSSLGAFNISSGNGGSGYLGAPAVVVTSNGAGTGATAIADITGGVITGVTITSPGQGWTAGQTLSFAFNGGGATTAAPTFNYTIPASDPNVSTTASTGGLTKIGTGVLTLSGQNTYTGTTAINSGVLNVGASDNGSSGPLGNGGTISFNGGMLQYSSSNQYDYSSRFSTASGQQYSIDTNGQNVSFATALTSLGGSLTKLGNGTLTLAGLNTYSGLTNVSGGTLAIASTSGLGNTNITVANGATLAPLKGSGTITLGTGSASLTVNSGGTLNLADGSVGALSLVNAPGATALTLGTTGGSAANLDFDLGATGADQINVTGNVSVLSKGVITVNVLSSSVISGSYPLITAGAFNGTNFSLAASTVQVGNSAYGLSLSNTGTKEMLAVQQVIGSLPTAYWAGGINGVWSTNNSGSTNWRTDATGSTDTATIPDATTNVFFSVNAGSSNPATTLATNQSINSLTFNGNGAGAASGPISISGATLTIDGFSLNGNAAGNGITVSPSVATATTINSNIFLNASQNWTNYSASPLVINGAINGSIGAVLTQAGSGPLTLAGINSFAGGFTTGGGILNLNSPAALGTGAFTIAGAVVLDNTSGAAVTLTTNNPQVWNNDFTFNGTYDLNLGTGPVTLGNSRQVTVNAGNLTVGGPVTDGGAGYTLTATGTGNLNLNGGVTGATSLVAAGTGALNVGGNSSYSGSTSAQSGSINFTGSNSGDSSLTVGSIAGQSAMANINSTGTLVFGGTGGVQLGQPGASGALIQTSGNLTLYDNINSSYFVIGNGGYGSYTLAGGTLTIGTPVNQSGVRIGYASQSSVGIFMQTGGTMSLSRYFAIGSGGIGSATFTGGTATVTVFDTLISDKANSLGVLNIGTQAGGNAIFNTGASSSGSGNGIAGIQLLNTADTIAGSGGTLNLNAGTLILTAGGITQTAAGNGFVNLNGATIKAVASGQTLIDNTPTAVTVFNGGANFDVIPGNSAIVSANLQGAAGNGIYAGGSAGSFNIPGGTGSGYIGAPYVFVSGGSGSGATAIADVSNGTITGVTLTSPGQNYQIGDTINFSFDGGGSQNPSGDFNYTLTAADIAPNAGGLTKSDSGLLTLTGSNTYPGPTNVAGGTLVIGVAGALPAGNKVTVGLGATLVTDSQATVNSMASLNINGNMIVHNGSISALSTAVKTGYNNGAWNGSAGIVSTASASDSTHLHGLGVIQNDNGTGSGATLYSTFEGQTVVDSDVLVKYTYYGDTNLDGKVDGSDYSRIDAACLANKKNPGSMTGWFNGDFNYDGIINGSDYTLIDNAFNTQGAQISAELATATAQVAGVSLGASAVPEPTTFGLVGISVVGLLRRRSRRRC